MFVEIQQSFFPRGAISVNMVFLWIWNASENDMTRKRNADWNGKISVQLKYVRIDRMSVEMEW